MNRLASAIPLVVGLTSFACGGAATPPIAKAPVEITSIPLTYDSTVSLTPADPARSGDVACNRAIVARGKLLANQVGRTLREAGFHMRSSLRNPGDMELKVTGIATCGGPSESDPAVQVTVHLALGIRAQGKDLAVADGVVSDSAGTDLLPLLVDTLTSSPALVAFARSRSPLVTRVAPEWSASTAP